MKILQKIIVKWIPLIIFGIVFVVSSYQIINILYGYHQGSNEYTKLKEAVINVNISYPEFVHAKSEDGSDFSSTAIQEVDILENILHSEAFIEAESSIDFTRLKEINKDSVAWIIMNGTKINYPIMLSKDNKYYLNHTIYGTENRVGTLFMDAALTDAMDSKNVIVYGHNMKDDTMFGTLSYYEDVSMWKSNPFFLVYTEDNIYPYLVFAAYYTEESSNTYTHHFLTNQEFMDYINHMKTMSLYDTGVTVEMDDQIITLSTCTTNENMRFVVQAKRVKQNGSNTSKNEN